MIEEEKNELENPDTAKEPPRIQITTIKVMVAAYLLWIVEKIVIAVIKKETYGAHPFPLILACIFLFTGVCWLLIPEFLKWYRAQKHDK